MPIGEVKSPTRPHIEDRIAQFASGAATMWKATRMRSEHAHRYCATDLNFTYAGTLLQCSLKPSTDVKLYRGRNDSMVH